MINDITIPDAVLVELVCSSGFDIQSSMLYSMPLSFSSFLQTWRRRVSANRLRQSQDLSSPIASQFSAKNTKL